MGSTRDVARMKGEDAKLNHDRNGPTVFVVDDDEVVRDSLRWLLEAAGFSVETCVSGEDFLKVYDPRRPGCLIVDLRMLGMSGLDVQKILAEKKVPIPTIFLTGYGTIPHAVRAMRGGALDFITKPYNDQALLDRVEQCLERDRHIRRKHVEQARIEKRLASLTPREREVMEHVVVGESNKAIATKLAISQKTIEAHRAKVMEKMQADSLAKLVRMVVPDRNSS
ncbi:MAG: response regulator transcription factor [Acidiferrobacterales bacterium]